MFDQQQKMNHVGLHVIFDLTPFGFLVLVYKYYFIINILKNFFLSRAVQFSFPPKFFSEHKSFYFATSLF